LASGLRLCRELVRTGRHLYRADNPRKVQLTTAAPRTLLQCVFLILAGRVIAGPGGDGYALTGAIAYVATGRTIIYVSDVTMNDRFFDTYYRLQAGRVRPWIVYVLRLPPYIASGFLATLLALAICGPALGLWRQSVDLLPMLPVYLLMACTCAAFGLAIASLAITQFAEILVGNVTSFLILATARIVAPETGSAHWLADLGAVLPLQHGLAAIRAYLAGRPWGGQLLLEVIVGGCWLLIAIGVLQFQDRRARGARPLWRLRPAQRTMG
jgi:ABC-type polysaccharide/polyol phosphate export permease